MVATALVLETEKPSVLLLHRYHYDIEEPKDDAVANSTGRDFNSAFPSLHPQSERAHQIPPAPRPLPTMPVTRPPVVRPPPSPWLTAPRMSLAVPEPARFAGMGAEMESGVEAMARRMSWASLILGWEVEAVICCGCARLLITAEDVSLKDGEINAKSTQSRGKTPFKYPQHSLQDQPPPDITPRHHNSRPAWCDKLPLLRGGPARGPSPVGGPLAALLVGGRASHPCKPARRRSRSRRRRAVLCTARKGNGLVASS